MSDLLDLTILYESDEDGWVIASIREIPDVFSQGRTRSEAREMVLSALGDWLRFYVEDFGDGETGEPPVGADTEPVHLTFAAA